LTGFAVSPVLEGGIKGHNIKGNYLTGKPRPLGCGALFVKKRAHLYPAEVDLFTRSGSVADPIAKSLITSPGKLSSVKVQRVVRFTCQVPPLKREDGAGRPPRASA